MLHLITILLLSLTFFAIGNIRQSNYGKIAFSISERWRSNRSIVNVLNWMSRNFESIAESKIIPKLEEDDKSKSRQENAEKRVRGYAVLRMVKYLLGNSFAHMIELWNPEDETKPRLLSERYQEKLQTGRETDYKKGGISPFQLTQIAIAIGQRYVDQHEKGVNFNVKEIDNADLFKIAEEYHAEKARERKARRSKKESAESETEQVESDVTVEDYLNGNFDVSECTDVELLQQFREDEAVTGAKKGILTRKINQLTS